MQEYHIETDEALARLCQRLQGNSWLALDTEFMREKSYYPQFCLLQLSDGELAASIDPLSITDLEPLRALLFNQGITKVFHAGRQDLEIFYHLWNSLPGPVFDTQLAATVLGLGDQVGYANLVAALLGTQLEKGHTRTDWSARPLEISQLRYALDDVIYLGRIYLKLQEQLKSRGRASWLDEDFRLLVDPASYCLEPGAAWRKIKGRQHLRGAQLAVLQSLAEWREQAAQKRDRPKRWILKDEVLIDLARRQPKNLKQLERIRGLESATLQRRGELLLKLIGESAARPREEWPGEEPRSPRLTPPQEALTDLLSGCLRLLAEQANINPSALANRRELEKLVLGVQDLPILHGWRRVLAGEQLLAVVEGRMTIRVTEGNPELIQAP